MVSLRILMKSKMKQVRIIAVSLITMAVAICSCSNHETSPSQMVDPGMESEIYEVMTSGDFPSVQIAVVERNQIVLSKTFGDSSSPDSLYMNGSVQKVFDAAAILQLHERGLVDLDEDISAYLPFKISHPEYPDNPVTIRMMLSHRSGLDAFKDQF